MVWRHTETRENQPRFCTYLGGGDTHHLPGGVQLFLGRGKAGDGGLEGVLGGLQLVVVGGHIVGGEKVEGRES